MRCKGTYTHKLEGGHRVPRAAAIWLIRCGICRGDGGCAFSIQVEDMHGALVTGDCQIVGWVPSREGNAENPGWVCPPSKLLAQRGTHPKNQYLASQPGVVGDITMSTTTASTGLVTICHELSFRCMSGLGSVLRASDCGDVLSTLGGFGGFLKQPLVA